MSTPADNKDRLMMAEQRRTVDVEKVIQASLFVASDHFNQRAEDPGWGAEMHEEMLHDAICEAAASVAQAKIAKDIFEGKRPEPSSGQGPFTKDAVLFYEDGVTQKGVCLREGDKSRFFGRVVSLREVLGHVKDDGA